VPHTLLLLADVSLPLQEEEQIAWKRLIRVLGHELSNSLAPIKSIAGSLLARVDNMQGEDATLRDFAAAWAWWRAAPTRCIALCSPIGCWRSCRRRSSSRFRWGRCWSAWCCSNSAAGSARSRAAGGARCRSRSVGADVHQPAGQRGGCIAGQRRSAGARRLALDDSALLVTIEDRGMGIANAENLFVPFYTTKPAGSGVGLALAQQIARAHGGEISLVNREDGEGARATIGLPLRA
jgi:two-component system nitrogen regulation sensor histidine kinase NtrY